VNALKNLDEQKSAISALTYIITNAARFDVNDVQLSTELQQLGLPKEHSESLSRSYKTSKSKLIEKFKTETLKCNM
jgi:hypothetical protein